MLRVLSTTAIVLGMVLGASGVSAQSLRDSDGPAEYPPSSYTGKQYVDSKGCVFVRAGVGGATTWVPRVSRSRKLLCGQSPTFAAAPKPEIREAPVVVEAPVAKPAPAPAAPKPKPTIVATQPKPTPAVAPPTPRVVVAAPAPKVQPVVPPRQVVTAAPAPKPTPRIVKPVATTSASTCPGLSSVSARYAGSGSGVRCGPQAVHPTAGYVKATTSGGGDRVTGVPVETVTAALPPVTTPAGYRTAFSDDRLNPNRGLRNGNGNTQTKLVWTATAPRRLVDQNTGRDVTALYPDLRFPFISMAQQTKYVRANGWPAQSGDTSGGSVVVSAKNTPATAAVKPKPAVSNGHKFVQVGTFGKPGNAEKVIARLQQIGLPVRVGSYKKKGKTYKIVLAGPFGSAAALQNGLNAARRAGFSDAFTRK